MDTIWYEWVNEWRYDHYNMCIQFNFRYVWSKFILQKLIIAHIFYQSFFNYFSLTGKHLNALHWVIILKKEKFIKFFFFRFFCTFSFHSLLCRRQYFKMNNNWFLLTINSFVSQERLNDKCFKIICYSFFFSRSIMFVFKWFYSGTNVSSLPNPFRGRIHSSSCNTISHTLITYHLSLHTLFVQKI